MLQRPRFRRHDAPRGGEAADNRLPGTMAETGQRGGRRTSAPWRAFYDRTGGRAPRRTLALALDLFGAAPPAAGRAVDLGCGAGRDTVAMLARGWRVLAVDAEPAAIAGLRARIAAAPGLCPPGALEARVVRFESAALPPCALVNSSFALPLVRPARFAALWPRLLAALEPGGRVACQLFGDRDGWAGDPTITFHARADAEALLAPLRVELFDEEETDATTPRGARKHWHLFHIVARKP